MSDQRFEGLECLEGYEILPTLEGFDAYTLILWTKDRRFERCDQLNWHRDYSKLPSPQVANKSKVIFKFCPD